VFLPKYRGKVLEGEVAKVAEEIIRKNCKELDIDVITNFLERNIKNNKKIEKLLYTYVILVIIG
jgi:REP element-mobilizing transposase RayT